MTNASLGSTRLLLFGFLTLLVLLVIGVKGNSGEDQVRSPSCRYCGMDRTTFAHSRMLIRYLDGSLTGVCSLHCAVIDLALNIDRFPQVIQVGDYNSLQLIDAEASFWVIGGDRPGVMTKRAKWAFLSKSEADEFVQQHGGMVTNFESAAQAAFEDMYEDVRMIRQKRKSMRK